MLSSHCQMPTLRCSVRVREREQPHRGASTAEGGGRRASAPGAHGGPLQLHSLGLPKYREAIRKMPSAVVYRGTQKAVGLRREGLYPRTPPLVSKS